VLPLKAIGFYEVSRHNRAKCLLLGLVFSAGLITTFAVLALLVVVLKVVAWGEIFGQAWFAAVIVAVLLLMAAGTFGAFSVALPQSVYYFTPRHDTLLGNFLFGILTAVLSTPCTFGMFLGLLLWATTQPAFIGTLLLMTVGAGMALPYLLLSAVPELARRFPRSGPWSEIVKQMMGFLLLATAVYFARRFAQGWLSDQTLWWVLFAVVAAAALFLVVRTIQLAGRPGAILASVVVALLILGLSLAVTLRLTYVPIDWQPYTPQSLAAARAAKQTVLVKFTASWCGNCQALEATVFIDKQIVQAVRQKNILMLKADVTDSHAPGWSLLKELNPAGGIPYTLIYTPGQPAPRPLAGIYTAQDLLSVLPPRPALSN
jgi:thiol:disulfide interchange protein DsbD